MNSLPSSLADWLALIELRHPESSITLGLERVATVWARLNLMISCPLITVGGTNGKGSTCALLEAIYLRAGYRVGLHTSPHLLRFNERIRINGAEQEDALLVESFKVIEAARKNIELSYFEFTLLAFLYCFAQTSLDVIILEVGLGGRLDATNILDADVAIVTSIDLDHMAYLGTDREAIGREKARIFRAGKTAICSDPQAPQSIIKYAQALGADLWLSGRDFFYKGDTQQWDYYGRKQKRQALAYPALRGANQLLNASAALAALEALHPRLPICAQDVRTGLASVELIGRFQVLPGRPTVILDVAHNPHAAATLKHNLENMGYFPYTYAIFASMLDKDIIGIVKILKNHVDHWMIAPLDPPRGASAELLDQQLQIAGTACGSQLSVQAYESVALAYHAACEHANKDGRIVVFGSFHTVASVLRARP